MATIQMVNRLEERRGLALANEIVARENDVTAVCWWADDEESSPKLLVGFGRYGAEGPLAAINRLGEAFLKIPEGDAPEFFHTEAVAGDDPRLQALVPHPWTTVPLSKADLTYRLINVWSNATGPAQALVYFLKAGNEVRVPLPPAQPQAA